MRHKVKVFAKERKQLVFLNALFSIIHQSYVRKK